MNYRKIDQRVQQLTTKEAFTYFCLALKSDYNTYETHIKQKNLLIFLEEQGLKINEKTLRRYLKRFEEVGLVEIERRGIKGKEGFFLRNAYQLSTKHYELIDEGLLKLPVSAETKGFLIILWLTAYNNEQYIALTNAQIAEKTKLGKNSIPKFINEALDKEILIKKKSKGKRDELHFANKEVFIYTPKSLGQTMIDVYGCALSDEELDAYKIVS